MNKILKNNWKPILLAVSMWPLMIIGPEAVGLVLPGGWSSLQQYPQDDSIEIEFLIRVLLIGVIPAAIYPKHFYCWPIISWITLATFVSFWDLLKTSPLDFSFNLLIFGMVMSLPFIALSFIGALSSRTAWWLYNLFYKR
ncbi:MAG: hypothetical protein OEV42_04790 [Deltaproteobacteria bacterium]|nr:hypothetical protein [Deltaproteobacteria bacterium]